MVRTDQLNRFTWVLSLAAVAIVVGALYLAKNVLVPLTLAALLTFLLTPVCDWLERRRLGRVPAVLLTVMLAFGILGIVVWTAAAQLTSLAKELPVYQQNIRAKMKSVNDLTQSAWAKLTKAVESKDEVQEAMTPGRTTPLGSEESPYSVRVIEPPTSPVEIFQGMFGTVLEGLGAAGIVIVLLIFFLLRREDLRDRFIHLISNGNVTATIPMLEDAARRVSRYLSMLFIINVSFGMSVSIGLYFIGLPNAMLWGILAALFRFIPYIGPWIAAVMPIALSMAISPGWMTPLMTVGLFVVLELFSNNVMEPWLYGKNTGVSSVAVLLAAIFWMWLWGPVGLLLATPLTVCLLVIGKHVPQLAFLDVLLGNDPVFEPHTRVYQRLLAGDTEEAAELIDEQLEEKTLAEVYDVVLLPALGMAQCHLQRGDLSDDRHDFVLQSMHEMLQDRADSWLERVTSEANLADKEKAKAAESDLASAPSATLEEKPKEPEIQREPVPQKRVLCLPARTEADEMAAFMLTQVLIEEGYAAQTVKISSLASEMLDLVAEQTADVICISAMAPVAVMHARYLTKRVRARFPKAKLVVGLWEKTDDLSKAKQRIGCGASVVGSLSKAIEKVLDIAPPVPLPEPIPNEAAIDEQSTLETPSLLNTSGVKPKVA